MSERIMAEVSIAKSFKGILRIAHISDVESNDNDVFSNKSLYTTSDKLPKNIQNIGYPYALPALVGEITRYNYPEDSLRDKRVPVTDSVGNYLNWNVGLNGVTIGSNEKINKKLLKNDSSTFPVLITNHVIVGLEKIAIKDVKKKIQSEASIPDVDDRNRITIESSNNSRGMVIVKTNDSTRTVYSPSRLAKNGEVLMFRQDDYREVDGVKHYFTDFVNINDYIKEKLNKYLKGNVMEVPSGTVIYHACSLNTWRNEITDKGPKMQQRGTNKSWSIQGACKKRNTYDDKLIPLFKRDYLLCDGSSYKIVYVPKTFSAAVAPTLIENRERFFELFFNLGYYYTEKRILKKRPDSLYNSTNKYYNFATIQNSSFNNTLNWYKSCPDSKQLDSLVIDDVHNYIQNESTKQPNFSNVTDDKYSYLDDVDVLFQEDLATMLCCDEIYKFVREKQQKNNKTPKRNEIIKHLSNSKIPEEYIFNSFVGRKDLAGIDADVSNETNKSLLDITYKTTIDAKPVKIKLNLGREINDFNKTIMFYSPSFKGYKQVKIYNLPRVTYFIKLMELGLSDTDLLKYLHAFFTYNFQVPSFISDDFSPTFIGSGAYMINSVNNHKQNLPQSWSGGYTNSIIPHRHFIALSKGTIYNDDGKAFIEYEPYNVNWKYDSVEGKDPYNEKGEYDFRQKFQKGRFSGDPLTVNHFTLAEFCDGEVLESTGGKGGWNITMEDGSNSYILRDVPVKLQLAYEKDGKTPKKINGFKPLFAQTISSGDAAADKYSPSGSTYPQTIDYLGANISTSFNNADPRFMNAEPNRGITDVAYYEQISKVNDKKIELNLQKFNSCTSTSYFSMENVTLLPLIKI